MRGRWPILAVGRPACPGSVQRRLEVTRERFDNRPVKTATARRCIVFALGILLARLGAEVVVLNDDGAWNWLQDQRALVVGDMLVVGSVALGHRDPARRGHVEVATYHRGTRRVERHTLHAETTPAAALRWADDHSAPALLRRPDGRLLAIYSRHGQDPEFYFRVSTQPDSAAAWGDEQVFASPAGSRVTFPSLVHLAGEREGRGRTLLFYRGFNRELMPAWAYSDRGGEGWSAQGTFLQRPGKATPYVKYASDGDRTVHLAFTDGHRLDFNNGLFHAMYRDGALWRSTGERIGAVPPGIGPAELPTEIFRANADSVAMISDLELDAQGRPCVVYSVQMNTRPLRPRPVGADHRYRYARWNGTRWLDYEIAHAGTETHTAADDDCTGLAALDPKDVDVVYISTNSDPVSGAPLVSRADQKRHWEIFRGRTRDGGATWQWEAVTRNSTADNLRPIVPPGATDSSPVVWLRGEMRMPKDSALEVVTLWTRD